MGEMSCLGMVGSVSVGTLRGVTFRVVVTRTTLFFRCPFFKLRNCLSSLYFMVVMVYVI